MNRAFALDRTRRRGIQDAAFGVVSASILVLLASEVALRGWTCC